jgi:hypothetical protein
MTKLQEIAAKKKALREAYLRAAAALDAEADAVRAAQKKAKGEKKDGGTKSKAKAKPAEEHKPEDTTADAAGRAYEAASEAMKSAHPDHGGPGGAQFYSAHANWQRARANYRPFM